VESSNTETPSPWNEPDLGQRPHLRGYEVVIGQVSWPNRHP